MRNLVDSFEDMPIQPSHIIIHPKKYLQHPKLLSVLIWTHHQRQIGIDSNSLELEIGVESLLYLNHGKSHRRLDFGIFEASNSQAGHSLSLILASLSYWLHSKFRGTMEAFCGGLEGWVGEWEWTTAAQAYISSIPPPTREKPFQQLPLKKSQSKIYMASFGSCDHL